MLESVYSEAWNKGFRVNLSVIPSQSGIDDLCVPPDFRQTGLLYSITNNEIIIKFLKDKFRRGAIEILLHGFSNSKTFLQPRIDNPTSSQLNKIIPLILFTESTFDTWPLEFVTFNRNALLTAFVYLLYPFLSSYRNVIIEFRGEQNGKVEIYRD